MSRNNVNEDKDIPRLLLVDDDELFCQVLAAALRKRGFHVSVAHDLATATKLSCQPPLDYAVIDLCLNGDSGLSLVEQLSKLSWTVKTIVLTGYASIATAVEAIKLGAVHYLTKPANADEIVTAFCCDKGNPEIPTPDRPLSIKRLEWEHLQKVLMEHNGNLSATARALGMHRRTLQRKLKKRPVKQ